MKNNFLKENEYFSKIFSPELYLSENAWPIRFIEQVRIKKIINLIDAKVNDKILEVGCGAGDILITLYEHIKKLNGIANCGLYGIDASKYMVERSRARVSRSIKIEEAMAEELPYQENSFNKIICSEVLEHVYDIDKALSEISRVLLPGGAFVITYPDENIVNFIKKGINITHMEWFFFPGRYQPEADMSAYWHKRKISFKYIVDKLTKYNLKIKKLHYLPPLLPVKRIIYGIK